MFALFHDHVSRMKRTYPMHELCHHLVTMNELRQAVVGVYVSIYIGLCVGQVGVGSEHEMDVVHAVLCFS